MIISDFHTHSSFSTDSTANPEDMILKAISLNLKKYCFTDHMDYMYPHPSFGPFTFEVKDYFSTLTELKQRYANQIEILIGVELGLRNEPDIKQEIYSQYKSLTNQYPFDFVLGSTHVLEHFDPYYKEFWTHRSSFDGIKAYFEAITHNAKYYDMFQICSHLDYIIRYIPEANKQYEVSDYEEFIDDMLRAIIVSGKGIECNTSGFKYGLSDPHPKREILKRYKELGGELLTIGSDAHKPEHIAYDFQKATELLKELGFSYYTVYKNQKPEFLKLQNEQKSCA